MLIGNLHRYAVTVTDSVVFWTAKLTDRPTANEWHARTGRRPPHQETAFDLPAGTNRRSFPTHRSRNQPQLAAGAGCWLQPNPATHADKNEVNPYVYVRAPQSRLLLRCPLHLLIPTRSTKYYSIPESLFLFLAMIELVITCLADLLHPATGTVVLPRFIMLIAVVV
jgi:hypothetical protein